MERRVEPELLDRLPATNPRAIGSRRDLERLNAWMRHAAILSYALRTSVNGQKVRHIVELGAGDGKFMLRVAGRLAHKWPDVTVQLLDLHDVISPETRLRFRTLNWNLETVIADAFEALVRSSRLTCEVMVANLFLHHFTAERLRALFEAIASRTQVFIALEPSRSPFALAVSHCVRLMGCNEVTRHDAPVSVRAGFAGTDLSQLWPAIGRWSLRERSVGLFTHLFTAHRQEHESV